jgi:class 3 adenylate cyclase
LHSFIYSLPCCRQISGFDIDTYNRLRPVDLEVDLLITIARTARVARFVRSREVAKFTSQINWYWLYHHSHRINPLWHWNNFRERRRQAHLATLRGGSEEPGHFTAKQKRAHKRTSWGVLQIGVLAAVKAQAEAEAREAKDAESSSSKGLRVMDSVKWSLRAMGIMGNERLEIRRQISATKIQRAWRAHLRFEFASQDGSQDGDLESDVAWSGRSGVPNNPSEKIQHKRSVMRQYAQTSTRNNSGRLDRKDIRDSKKEARKSATCRPSESRFKSESGKGRESQVGSDMRELTGQRVAVGILFALVFTIIFTYTEADTTRQTTMIVLHEQTQNDNFRDRALEAAMSTTAGELYMYQPVNETAISLSSDGQRLRDREKFQIAVRDSEDNESIGWFAFDYERKQGAWVQLVATFFILLVWFFGVTAFAGPVMSLVVIPIERMVRLLGMLIIDPIGYQSTARFKKFLIEEDALIKNTRWTREVLKGMETSFLMSTILRIGSLMKVGFGSAGVEIIRNNLQKGQRMNMLNLTSKGITVSCIFLFCDIRQFTDATECLQEEVFVFTNRIAAVIHSICHSYGGAANKNVGDAFLLSWLLEDDKAEASRPGAPRPIRDTNNRGGDLKAKNNQADKALLSVIKICIALYYDKYYIETMSEAARKRLQNKLKNRPGPMVQMGFGLHAGKAVQGAIGSERKIDATYVSEAVERAEFLESSTKQYGLKMLMSDSFHRLLHPNTRRRCRKVDQILLRDDDDDEESEDDGRLHGEIMELFTFDMDVEAVHRPASKSARELDVTSDTESNAERRSRRLVDRRGHGSTRQIRRRRSVTMRGSGNTNTSASDEFLVGANGSTAMGDQAHSSPSIASASSVHSEKIENESTANAFHNPPELVLPSGPALYSHNIWQTPDMKRIRDKFVKGLFFQKFNAGLQAFYNKDWRTAQEFFQTILDNYDDGPSKYFMSQIKKNKGTPPKDFVGYGIA